MTLEAVLELADETFVRTYVLTSSRPKFPSNVFPPLDSISSSTLAIMVVKASMLCSPSCGQVSLANEAESVVVTCDKRYESHERMLCRH